MSNFNRKDTIMRNKLCIYIMVVSCMISVSCNKEYLERFPLDSPSNETFLTNETELEMAVTGVYNALWYSYSGTPFSLVFDYASDIAWERNTNDLQVLGMGLINPNNSFTSGFWTHFYVGIARCNNILDQAENLKVVVPEERYNQFISETRFLRAYYYFYLNELFGGVPLLTYTVSLTD